MLEIIIDNRDGNLWDLSGIVSAATLSTTRIGKAASFEFTLIKGGLYENTGFQYSPGDVVRVRKDGVPLFFGYIFSIDNGRSEAVKITAYDQIRYLMANDWYQFENVTVGEIIARIAGDMKLKVGTMEDTGYKIPSQLEDGTKLLDMICNALAATTVGTGKLFVFYDDFGELRLRNAFDWKLDISIGDVSLAYDYQWKRSIDSDTYNQIKLVRNNKEKGSLDGIVLPDDSNIAKWGLLQYYRKVDDNANEAQMQEWAKNLLDLKNRESRSFSIDAIGHVAVRAGCAVSINMAELATNHYFIVEECVHNFEGPEDHTMKLSLKVYGP
jgi:hypothetical protein